MRAGEGALVIPGLAGFIPIVENIGQSLILATGSFVVPANVGLISVVTVGRGGQGMTDGSTYTSGGGGGGLAYVNNIAVTAGETLTVTISDTETMLQRGGTTLCRATAGSTTFGGTATTGTGWTGGNGQYSLYANNASGGGAAGYTSNGGNASGASFFGGGGISVLGGGAGAAGNASTQFLPINGDTYGGGAGAAGSNGGMGARGPGAVRIMWGGARSFPFNAGNA